jgi:hypothetical protein
MLGLLSLYLQGHSIFFLFDVGINRIVLSYVALLF